MELPAPVKTAIQSRRTKVAGEVLVVAGLIKPAIALGRAAIGVISEAQTVVEVGRWLYHAPPLWLNAALVAGGGLLLYLSRRARPEYIDTTARRVDDSDKVGVQTQPLTTGAARYEIPFDYLPDSPMVHGWTQGYAKNPIPSDASWRMGPKASLMMELSNIYCAIDHAIPHSAGCLTTRFVCDFKFIEGAMLFLLVGLVTRDRTTRKGEGWIKFELGRGKPYYQKDYNEWVLPIDPQLIEDGWFQLDISLTDAVARTWGQSGWILGDLRSIRLRGHLGISPIKLF